MLGISSRRRTQSERGRAASSTSGVKFLWALWRKATAQQRRATFQLSRKADEGDPGEGKSISGHPVFLFASFAADVLGKKNMALSMTSKVWRLVDDVEGCQGRRRSMPATAPTKLTAIHFAQYRLFRRWSGRTIAVATATETFLRDQRQQLATLRENIGQLVLQLFRRTHPVKRLNCHETACSLPHLALPDHLRGKVQQGKSVPDRSATPPGI